MTEPILECPHCKEFIIIEKINCGIFRHGVLHLFSFKTPIFTSYEMKSLINNSS